MKLKKFELVDDRIDDFRLPTLRDISDDTADEEIEIYNAVWELVKKVIRKGQKT